MQEYDEKLLKDQLKYAKLQCRFAVITGVISMLVLCIVVGLGVYFVPRINSLMERTEDLVIRSEDSIENAMEKLNKIDFDTLNNAIVELENVIKPISDFFGVFRR